MGATAIVGTTTYASVVGTAVLAAGSYGVSQLTQQSKPTPQDGQVSIRQSIPWARRTYGETLVGGPYAFSERYKGTLAQVVLHKRGEISAIKEVWLGQDKAEVAIDGSVTNLYYSDGKAYVAVYSKLGSDDDTAFDYLVDTYPTIWTSEHRMRGIAKTLVVSNQPKAENFTKIFPGGQPPQVRVLAENAKVWVPTSGANRSVLEFTKNPVWIALDYCRHRDGMGLSSFDDILFTDQAIIEDWIPAAAICDELIANKDGDMIPRYICAGGYDLNEPPKTVLASIFSTCDGQIYQRPDGAIGVRVGKALMPTFTLTAEHILGYDSLSSGSAARLQAVNQVTAKYTDRNLDYQAVESSPWRDEASITATGREETRPIDLSWVDEYNQVRRLQKIAFYRFNPNWTGGIVTDLAGAEAYNQQYIRVQLPELLLDEIFEVGGWELNSDFTCTLQLSSMDPAAFPFNPLTEEGDPPSIPPVLDADQTVDPPENVLAPNPDPGNPIIFWTWDEADRDDAVAEAEYTIADAEAWFAASVHPDNTAAATPGLPIGLYDVRVRFRVGTLTSDWVVVQDVEIT